MRLSIWWCSWSGSITQSRWEGKSMRVIIKKNDEVILECTDVKKVTDKGGAYELIYENDMGRAVYKGNDVVLELY